MVKRKYLKKVTALVLAGIMGVSMLGCSGGAEDADATINEEDAAAAGESADTAQSSEDSYGYGDQFYAEEAVIYSLMYSDHENYPYQEDWLLWDAIEEATNVSFDLTIVARTDYVDKKSLLISSGEEPLIIPKTYPGSEEKFVASGAILPVSDYANEDYMPYYSQKVKDWNMESDLNQIRQADGKYYLLPGLHESAGGGYTYLIRKDIFDELGITIDEANDTYDDFYNNLLKVKEAYPDDYVVSDCYFADNLVSLVAQGFGVTAGWSKGTGEKFDWDTNQFFFGPASDNYKAFLTYMNQWIESGLLDPESFTQDDDSALAKFTTGKSFVISSTPQSAQDLMSTMDNTLGEDNYELYLITPPAGEDNTLPSASRLENGIMISSKALDLGEEEFKQFMNFVDWLWYSEEGLMLTKWGIEGTTYDMVDGSPVLNSDIYYNGVNQGAEQELNVDFGFSGGVFAYGGSDDIKTSMYTDFEKDYYNRTITLRQLPELDPPVMFDEETSESMSLITTPLMDYVTQMTNKFILGQESIDTGWDTYLEQCVALGSEQYIEECNSTYEETKQYLK